MPMLIDILLLGICSPIGEAGKLLSGGKYQRPGVARTLYQNTSALALDEVTSALDVKTEDATLLRRRCLCTTIVIAHRLRIFRECQRVALLVVGELVAIGSFDDLLAIGRRLSRLVELSRLNIGASFADDDAQTGAAPL